MKLSVSEAKRLGKQNMKQQWGPSLLVLVIYAVLIACGNVIPVLGALAIAGPLTYGLYYIYHYASKGGKINYWDIFKGFENNFGDTFLAHILVSIYTFLWSLLFIIPGIIKAYSYAMTMYVMAREDNIDCSEAIKKSIDYMKGNKMRLFMLDLSFLGWDILEALTFGILAVYVEPWKLHAKTLFFNDIYDKNNAVETTESTESVNINPEYIVSEAKVEVKEAEVNPEEWMSQR